MVLGRREGLVKLSDVTVSPSMQGVCLPLIQIAYSTGVLLPLCIHLGAVTRTFWLTSTTALPLVYRSTHGVTSCHNLHVAVCLELLVITANTMQELWLDQHKAINSLSCLEC